MNLLMTIKVLQLMYVIECVLLLKFYCNELSNHYYSLRYKPYAHPMMMCVPRVGSVIVYNVIKGLHHKRV